MLLDKDQDPTALGSLQRIEEVSKFAFREYIVGKNTYKLDLEKCYIQMSLYVKDNKNYIEIAEQDDYQSCLKGLQSDLQTSGFVTFEVRVFLYNMTKDDVSKMSKMSK